MPFVSHKAMALPPLKIDRSLGLATIPDGMAYALCKSMMCRQCGHLFVDYRFSDAEMSALYGDYRGRIYTELRESYEPGYSERNKVINDGASYLDQVEDFLDGFVPESDIAVLDWGGDTGTNTPFKERRAFLHIFDPSAKSADIADASFSSVPAESAESLVYDLIVLSEVLEHIPFPGDSLRAIRPFMSSSTILYVEVPLERLQQSATGFPYSGADKKKYWHEHINFFTSRSMEILLNRSGYTVLSRKILDLSASHEKALGSALNLLQFACRRQDD
jgi:hypothetical protein